jgi:hypothetical protein
MKACGSTASAGRRTWTVLYSVFNIESKTGNIDFLFSTPNTALDVDKIFDVAQDYADASFA